MKERYNGLNAEEYFLRSWKSFS